MTALPMSADAVRAYVEMARKRGLIFITPPLPAHATTPRVDRPRDEQGRLMRERTDKGRSILKGKFTIHDVQVKLGMGTYNKAKAYLRVRREAGVIRYTGIGKGTTASPMMYEWADPHNREE